MRSPRSPSRSPRSPSRLLALPAELREHVLAQLPDCAAAARLCAASRAACDDRAYAGAAAALRAKGTDFFLASAADPLWAGVADRATFVARCKLSRVRDRLAAALARLDALHAAVLAERRADAEAVQYEFTVEDDELVQYGYVTYAGRARVQMAYTRQAYGRRPTFHGTHFAKEGAGGAMARMTAFLRRLPPRLLARLEAAVADPPRAPRTPVEFEDDDGDLVVFTL